MVNWPGRKRPTEAETRSEPAARINFTPAARQKLLEVLAPEGPDKPAAALRIVVKNAGFGPPQYDMALEPLDAVRAEDTVIDAGGFSVLVDPQSLPEVNGATVDFVSDPLRPGFQVEPPREEVPAGAIGSGLDPSDPLAQHVRAVIDRQINPGIAAHGGHAELVGIKDDIVYVALGGGCQGCSMASVTLKQGIEQLIKQAVPRVRAVVDATDHAHGTNPFYTAEKGGESPFHQAAKG
jgi:Fe/S biogenesis protein NfuA